jgi:hypothetical protein
MESGIADATINPARRLPRKMINTKITINAASSSLFYGINSTAYQVSTVKEGFNFPSSGNIF